MENTKEKILEATEHLILEHGWHRVTIRMITAEAGVNLAAINYHFGSRDALEDALVPRILNPMYDKCMSRLEDIEKDSLPVSPAVELIIRSFLEPVLDFSRDFPNHHRMVQQFFSGVHDKRKLRAHFEDRIAPMVKCYIEVLGNTLPHVPREKLIIHFTLMFTSSHLLIDNPLHRNMMDSLGLGTDKETIMEELIELYSTAFQTLERTAETQLPS